MLRFLKSVEGVPAATLLQRRYDRFRKIGAFSSQSLLPSAPPATSAS
jgi:hypothetical protein